MAMFLSSFSPSEFDLSVPFGTSSSDPFLGDYPRSEASVASETEPTLLLPPDSPGEEKNEKGRLKRKRRENHKYLDLSAILQSPYTPPQPSGQLQSEPAQKCCRMVKKPRRIDLQAILHPEQPPEEVQSTPFLAPNKPTDTPPKILLQPSPTRDEAVSPIPPQPLWQYMMPALKVTLPEPRAAHNVSPTPQEERASILQIAKSNPLDLRNVNPEFFFDHEIFLEAIRKNYEFLQYAPPSLLDNKDYMLLAVRENGNCLRFAGTRCARHLQIVLEALRQNFSSIRFAAKELFQSYDFFLKAVEIDPATLWYNDILKEDENFILRAIRINPKALLYAATPLRNDLKFLRKAVEVDFRTFEFACSSARTNAGFVISLLKKCPKVFFFIDGELRKSPEFLLNAMTESMIVVFHMEESLKNDKNLQQKIVEKDGLALQYLNIRWQRDPDIVLAAVRQNKGAYIFAKESAKTDPAVREALKI